MYFSPVLEEILAQEGVESRLSLVAGQPTGHCLGLVQGDERTLCANIGAAAHYSPAHLWAEGNRARLGQATMVLVEGFFLSHSPEVVMEIAKFCQAENILFVFNLCGEYVCQDPAYCSTLISLLPYINILFGNKNEYDVFTQTVAQLPAPALSDDVKQKLESLVTGATATSSDQTEPDWPADCDIELEPEDQVAIVTDSYKPVQCFSLSNNARRCQVTVPPLSTELIKASPSHRNGPTCFHRNQEIRKVLLLNIFSPSGHHWCRRQLHCGVSLRSGQTQICGPVYPTWGRWTYIISTGHHSNSYRYYI